MSSSPAHDSSIKPVRLTGSAAAELSGGSKAKRRTPKKGGKGSEFSSPSSPSSPSPSASPSPSPSPSASPSPSVPSASTSIPTAIVATPSEGGAKTIRVELKKRASTKKVQLQPKGVKKLPASLGSSAVTSSPSSQTKKGRRVTLGVKSLHKRMSRAKKMTRKVKEMSLLQLREHLIQKKLIKPTSKAPESILRQIAADAQIVAGKAL